MEFVKIVVAGLASFGFGAIWYMSLAKPWMAASGVELDASGQQPANRSDPVPYITSLLASIIIAGMMRHMFTQRHPYCRQGDCRGLWDRIVSGHALDRDLLRI